MAQYKENVFSERLFEYRSTEKKKLILSFSITFLVMIIEFVGGIFTHSIALISDAGHMFTHCFAIGIIIAGILILQTGWHVLDPIVSLGISATIIFWAWGILKESAIILMEMAPTGLNVHIIADDLKATFPEIRELTNTHLWVITADMLVFSAHVFLSEAEKESIDCDRLIENIHTHLTEQYQIIESTIQILSDKHIGSHRE